MKQYFSFQWHITDECDQRCKHCYIFSEDNCKKLDAMTWKQMQDVVDNCCDMCEMYDPLPYFYITGGDPILHPDFWRLLELLKERDIPFTIMGNPFHLNDEVCRRLKSCGCQKYQLSLDGMRETHDWFRKPGSFDCTLEKISCIKNAGIRSVIMTTVSGTNIKDVPQIIDTVVKYGVDVFAFARYCPTSEEKDTGITPEEYRELLDAYVALAKKAGKKRDTIFAHCNLTAGLLRHLQGNGSDRLGAATEGAVMFSMPAIPSAISRDTEGSVTSCKRLLHQ